jgi:hypothetical protein
MTVTDQAAVVEAETELAAAEKKLAEAREYLADAKAAEEDKATIAEAMEEVLNARELVEDAKEALVRVRLGPLGCLKKDRDDALRRVAKVEVMLANAKTADDVNYWTGELACAVGELAAAEDELAAAAS